MQRRTSRFVPGRAAAHELLETIAKIPAEGPGTVHALAGDIMEAMELDEVEPPRSHSPYRVPANAGTERLRGSPGEADPAMLFATVALLVASLVRLVPPMTGNEIFGVEPTLALGATIGCAWALLREGFFRLSDLRAARRAATMVRSHDIDRGPPAP